MTDMEYFNSYYAKVHPFLPFLPHSTEVLFSNLRQTSLAVNHAFQAALISLSDAGNFGSTPRPEIDNIRADYARMVSNLQHDLKSTQTMMDKLVALQAVLIMIFAAEFKSPATAGKHCIFHLVPSFALMASLSLLVL